MSEARENMHCSHLKTKISRNLFILRSDLLYVQICACYNIHTYKQFYIWASEVTDGKFIDTICYSLKIDLEMSSMNY